MSTKNEILQLSAFYNNDLPGGVGVTLGRDNADLDELMKTISTYNDAMWAEAAAISSLPELTSDLRSQLNAIGKKAQLGFTDALLTIGNVYILEKHGRMKTDNWNGLSLCYITHARD
jgi:hypothetical protein